MLRLTQSDARVLGCGSKMVGSCTKRNCLRSSYSVPPTIWILVLPSAARACREDEKKFRRMIGVHLGPAIVGLMRMFVIMDII